MSRANNDTINEDQKLQNYNSVLSLLTAGKGRQITNELVDDLFKSIGPKVKLMGLDPLKLPEKTVEFEKQICCKTYPGVADLKKGVLKGISNAKRHGEISINMGEVVEITFAIRVGPLTATYDSDVKLNKRIYNPRFIASVEYLDVLVDMALNIKEVKLDLRSLKVTEVAPINVKVENMSIFFRFLVKPVVKHMVDSESKLFMAKVNTDLKENLVQLTQNALNIKRLLPGILS